MRSITEKQPEKTVTVVLTESELRYLLRSGAGLLQNIAANSLPTYVNFSADEIVRFGAKIRHIMDENDISL